MDTCYYCKREGSGSYASDGDFVCDCSNDEVELLDFEEGG